MSVITRRAALILIAGGAAAAGGGYAFIRSLSDEELVLGVLERYLGPIEIAEDDLADFVRYFQASHPWAMPGSKLADAYTAAGRLGLQDAALSALPADRVAALEHFERWLLAEFHTVTDIGWRTASEDPVYFMGPSACLNPFAEFEAV